MKKLFYFLSYLCSDILSNLRIICFGEKGSKLFYNRDEQIFSTIIVSIGVIQVILAYCGFFIFNEGFLPFASFSAYFFSFYFMNIVLCCSLFGLVVLYFLFSAMAKGIFFICKEYYLDFADQYYANNSK